MSRADLSAGAALRASGPAIETASRSSPTHSSTSAGFPDLLTKMARTAGNASPSRPAISIAEHRRAWDRDASQAAPAPDEKSEGGEPELTSLPVGESEPPVDAKDQSSAAPQLATPSPLDAISIVGTSPMSGAGYGSTPAMTGVCVSHDSPVGRNDFAFPKAPTTDAATPKETPPDVRARSIGAPQGAREKPDILAPTLPPAADAAMLKETSQDFRAAASGGAAAAQLVSVVAQETHIAPVVPPSLGQGARYRAERVTDARDRSAPEQGTEQGDTVVLAARVEVLAAGKPLRPSPEQLASVGRSSSEQGAASNADGELGSSAPPADHSVPAIANEVPRATGAVPQPLHQVAGQIVAAASAVQREEAQPIGTVAAKPLASSVVKILHLELQPADLGTITIRMSLKQDALDIRVEASRYDTACMLQRDQDSLAKILTSAGCRIDGMTVVTAATDGAAVSDGRSQGFLPSATPQHGGASQQDSRSSGGRANAEPNPRSSPGKQNDDNDKSRTARGAGGDLYV